MINAKNVKANVQHAQVNQQIAAHVVIQNSFSKIHAMTNALMERFHLQRANRTSSSVCNVLMDARLVIVQGLRFVLAVEMESPVNS